MNYSQEHLARGEVVTGLLFVDPQPEELHGYLNTVRVPFNRLGETRAVPRAATLAKINTSLR
jgi:2-oxoglutarate ferredoxin oxidoreductase subunit beta